MKDLGTQNIRWDLSIFYDSPCEIEKDLNVLKVEIEDIAQTYRGEIARVEVPEFLNCLKRIESVDEKLAKVSAYVELNYSLQTHNGEAEAFVQRVEEFASFVRKELIFFRLEWTDISDHRVEKIFENPETATYQRYLNSLRKYRPHLLLEVEERLLAELAPIGTNSWIRLFEKTMSHIQFGEKKRTQEEVLTELYHSDREVRQQASHELTQGLQSQIHIFTHIFNAITTDKWIHDRLRKYPHWARQRHLSNEISDEVVDALVSACRSRYDLPQRYYCLKRDLLGVNELYDYDRYAPLPSVEMQVISWGECRQIVIEAYGSFSHELADIAIDFFDGPYIDAPMASGKVGGAFALPATKDTHPFILLNYAGTLRDVETVGHEIGHGIHQILASQNQTYYNSDTPLITAETASVFGEMLTFQSLYQKLETPQQKLSALCAKLESIFATVFRQISMFQFENLLHIARRNEGELTQTRISDLWIESQQEMFGESIIAKEHYRIWWCYIPHFLHAPGYVYSYAFGELLTLALYQQYLQAPDEFPSHYLKLLKSGGSQTPDDLLQPFGVDLQNPKFWLSGLSAIEDMLEEAENIASLQK